LIAPDEALRLLNADLLSAELQESPFITMVYGILDARTHQVDYALAGHPKPILLAPGGGFSELDGDGSLLGIFRDAVFQTARCQLSPGERLLLYSDGAERVDPRTQANPEEFRRLVRRFAACPLEEMLDRLLEAVHDATEGEPLADDVTFVAMDLHAQAEPRP
jgi:sigma-B regulation protein RsbU (phosphoserine phosphatase)